MSLTRIVLASRNPKKVRELEEILGPFGIEVLSLSAFPDAPEIEETGDTFEANARLKAEGICAATGEATLADDSGLVVDALNGEPGVRSARFAGENATDADNNAQLLKRLAEVSEDGRGAAFACVIAFARPGCSTLCFSGGTRGRILEAPRGQDGFGYDPLFLSDDLGRTFAESASEEKHRVSHRGRALAKFLEFCRTQAESG